MGEDTGEGVGEGGGEAGKDVHVERHCGGCACRSIDRRYGVFVRRIKRKDVERRREATRATGDLRQAKKLQKG